MPMGNDSALTEAPLQVKTALRSLTDKRHAGESCLLLSEPRPLIAWHLQVAYFLCKTDLTIVCLNSKIRIYPLQ